MLGAINKIPDMVAGDVRIFTKGANVNLRSEPNTTSKVVANVATTGTEVGTYTKYYANDASNFLYKWYEFTGKYGNGWIRNDLATLAPVSSTVATTPKNSDAEAQAMINEVSKMDTQIINDLNVCAVFADSLLAKGKNINTQTAEIKRIYESVAKRQAEIEKSATQSKWGKVTDKISSAASSAWGSLKKFFGLQGIGIVITTTTLIIVAIAVAAGAGATALAYIKPWKDASNIDKQAVEKIRKELEAAGLDKETIDKVADIASKGIVDAFETGKNQADFENMFDSLGNMFKNVKFIAIAGIALLLAPTIMDMMSENKTAYRKLKR